MLKMLAFYDEYKCFLSHHALYVYITGVLDDTEGSWRGFHSQKIILMA